MLSVSVAEMKSRLIELIEQLPEEGEIIITRRGQAVARLKTVPRIRLADHTISSPMPLAGETMPSEFDDIYAGPLSLR